ncbi:MAG: ferrous iron transporter B [Firmicutes bacterium]|nr:ferrous iron transporter B [Bacillota bacterium]
MNPGAGVENLLKEAQAITGGQPEVIRDNIVKSIYDASAQLAGATVSYTWGERVDRDRQIDNILTSPLWGFPIMFAVLAVVFWVTISGANYPSAFLSTQLFWLQDRLNELFWALHAPEWLRGVLVMGAYRSLAWVVSVMLPPMAIFFPLFTLLEDAGYLPRVAFNLDRCFKKAGAHGKQALTMCMGFGCNAAGVIACRIIDSPRERLIATLTNNFVPCNGRFPTIIALAGLFAAGSVSVSLGGLLATFCVASLVVFGVAVTLAVSWFLSRTILKGTPSSFTLELPPYRKPQVGQVLVRSILDRTIFVLGRAAVLAAPAGGLVWLMANITLGHSTVLAVAAGYLDPLARLMGLDGFILLAFILGLPANEIVLPILLMSYLAGGAMVEAGSLAELRNLLVVQHGWTWLTGLCTVIFALCHWPCGTTLFTIQREQKNWRWTLLAAVIPAAVGMLICMTVTALARVLHLV